MLELTRTSATVITCVGAGGAVDAAVAVGRAFAGRIAPDEVMLIGPLEHAASLSEEVEAAVRPLDPYALVVDATDGWAIWTLQGDADDVDRAMARLTALELPGELSGDGFLQGDVARVPVKLVVAPERVDMLVPAMWEAYLRARILERCATLQVHEQLELSPWELVS